MPHLDGLRALAVGAVLMEHFWAPWALKSRVPLGAIGVRLFFVLSGFLITAILLNAKGRVDAGIRSARSEAARFYARRALRLFPIFYLTIAAAAIAGIQIVRDSLWWHLFYTSNLFLAVKGSWSGPIAHFWSLAVEEQFYFIWPAVVLLCPREWLIRIAVCGIAASVVFDIALIELRANAVQRAVLLPACLDSLGAGALLSLLDPSRRRVFVWWCRCVAAPCATALLVLQAGAKLPPRISFLLIPLMSFAYVAVVEYAASGRPGFWNDLLSLRPLTAIGRISYGVYVYHLFCPPLILGVAALLRVAVPWEGRALLPYVLTFLLAWVSWVLVERPIQSLKERLWREDRLVRSVSAAG